ncbi:peptidylprolyl isomerase [Acetivibrio straminisolvens]|uniref:peptidylprolyl isomerase n=1 Tax=Acetivibrio straminisolvens TaxID=253314 RepID=UPI00223ED146|nr:peptidylprolyl isomerase [Acetivibrio straminisolvens]
MADKKKIAVITGIVVLIAAIIIASVCGYNYFSKRNIPEEPNNDSRFEVLKINGTYVSSDIMKEESNKFFEKYKRNAEVLRMNEFERNDMFLDQVIERMLLEDYVNNKSGVTATDSEVEDYISRFVKPRYSDLSLGTFMSSQGYANEEEMKAGIKEYILRHKALYKAAKEKNVTLTEQELDEGYEKHKIQNKKVNIKHIFISSQERSKEEAKNLADEIYNRLNNNEDFESLAKEYSDDEETRESGGVVEELRAGFNEEVFDNAVFTSEAGQLLEPIEVARGYEIVYVDKVTEFYRTRDEYAELFTVEKFMSSDVYKEWFEEYKKNYDIEITDPAMKAFRLFREGQYSEAGKCYEELYMTEKDIYFIERACDAYKHAENWTKLIEMGQLAIKDNPSYVEFYIYQAEGEFNAGSKDMAEELLKEAEKKAADNTYYLDLIRRMYLDQGIDEGVKRIDERLKKIAEKFKG